MRPWLRVLLTLLVLGGIGIAAWWYARREQLTRQWRCYRVGAAGSFDQAKREIAWFETGTHRQVRLDELVRKWGTGNGQFDLYLARYVDHPASSELLREVFSKELGRRGDLLPRWAHYWSYRAPLEPDEQVASILAYLDTLYSTEPPKGITWREVLDLQAVFQLTRHGVAGEGWRARGLSPTSWLEYYRVWQETRPAKLPHVVRPEKPFADWQGR